MGTQSNTKKTVFLLLGSVILVSSCLLEGIKSSLHNLRGKYFPENFPMVGGYSPNDFLLWGVLVFFVFGLITVNFFYKKYDGRKAWFAILQSLTLITAIMIILANLLTYREGLIWRNEAGGLILVWIIAYWVGVTWTYSYHRLKTFFNKSVDNI